MGTGWLKPNEDVAVSGARLGREKRAGFVFDWWWVYELCKCDFVELMRLPRGLSFSRSIWGKDA